MANGWLPRDGEEWMRWMEQRARIQERRPHTTYEEVVDAVDASAGVDTVPQTYYIEGGTDTEVSYLFPEGEFVPGEAESGGF